MSVGKADANGAGSVGSPVSAPTTTDSAARTKEMPKPGLADGANTTWSTARKSVQVAEASKRSGSLDFKRIDGAIEDVQFAKLRFVVANNKYVDNKNDDTRAAYAKEKEQYRKAQIELGLVIDNQTNKRAQDSSLYPRGHGLKNCAEVRQLEKKMLDRASPLLKEYLEGAISENRDLRAPRELKALAKLQETNGKLNPAQTRERAHIIGDATDAVTGKHWEDADLAPSEVTKNRLDRVEQLLKAATTGNAQKFDPALYDDLTANIRSQMGSLDAASNERFNAIVAKYSDRLEPEINIGP